jgi:tetratricopeptide (TPR) repeat protein
MSEKTGISESYDLADQYMREGRYEEAIELYQTQLLPISKIIRDALYDINTVLHKQGKFELIQIKTAFHKLIFDLESPEVISNKK